VVLQSAAQASRSVLASAETAADARDTAAAIATSKRGGGAERVLKPRTPPCTTQCFRDSTRHHTWLSCRSCECGWRHRDGSRIATSSIGRKRSWLGALRRTRRLPRTVSRLQVTTRIRESVRSSARPRCAAGAACEASATVACASIRTDGTCCKSTADAARLIATIGAASTAIGPGLVRCLCRPATNCPAGRIHTKRAGLPKSTGEEGWPLLLLPDPLGRSMIERGAGLIGLQKYSTAPLTASSRAPSTIAC